MLLFCRRADEVRGRVRERGVVVRRVLALVQHLWAEQAEAPILGPFIGVFEGF